MKQSNPHCPASASRKALRWFAVCLLLAGSQAPTALAATTGGAQEQKARLATFEVVVPKPPEDRLRYERPLPMELVPYAIRQDKYQPIGTAFALDKTRYVTAAHVLAGAMVGSHQSVLIREQDGTVHTVAEILQFSLDEDYAVFSVGDGYTAKPLATNTSHVIGEPVLAIGNAFGEGIVIRDGLLTSETPEERDGAWHWLRFSAAASPGNSGGPLLDKKGRVIGVVVAVSPNENLNYALPIRRVLQPRVESTAQLRYRESFGLLNSSASIVATLDKSIALPLPYEKFAPAFVAALNEFYDESLELLVGQNQDRLFPNGESSRRLLTKGNWAPTLQIIAEQTNGEWDAVLSTRVADVSLPPDGELTIAQSSGMSVLKLVKPSDVALGDLFTNSALFMELLLKGMPLTRPVANQQVRIISLGAATLDTWHVDRYGRKWQLRLWPLGFADVVVAVMALPKPDGADLIVQIAPTALQHAIVSQFKFLADYSYMGYYAPLRDWQAYLALPELHPESFKQLRFEIDLGKRIRFSSPRFRFDLDNWLQDINEHGRLSIQFGYFQAQGKVHWDIVNFLLSEDPQEETHIKVSRWARPAPTSASDVMRSWSDLVARKGDFAGRPRYENPISSIIGVLDKTRASTDKSGIEPEFIYTVTLQMRNFATSEELTDMLGRAIKAVELLEAN